MMFADCGDSALGLYPVVPSVEWIAPLAELGVTTLQLRLKDHPEVEQQVASAVAVAKNFPKLRLFINDYWQLAIEHQAYGVHLGQSDLNHADCKQLANAGLRLGISTHNQAELERALTFKPSYVACGPIYPTTSKVMPYDPQGIDRLQAVVDQVSIPVVAIGGINLERVPAVLATGCSGIALISAITNAKDPAQATHQLLSLTNK